MTADYLSKKCGFASINTMNYQKPSPALFSPVISTTRPYTQTESNTQRALMLPDEILRLPNNQCLLLLRGQKPLLLYKIIPDELPTFNKLSDVKISDYLPVWRKNELEKTHVKSMKEKTSLPEEKISSKVALEKDDETEVTLLAPVKPVPLKYGFVKSEHNAGNVNTTDKENNDTTEENDDVISLIPIEISSEDIIND